MAQVPPYSPHQPGAEITGRDLVEAQSRSQRVLDPLVDKHWIAGSELLEGVALTAGFNDVNHKLGRKLRGWWLSRQQQSAVSLWASKSDTQSINTVSSTQVQLNAVTGVGTSDFSTTAYEFTAPHTGYYAISWQCGLTAIGDGKLAEAALYVDDVLVARGVGGASGAAQDVITGGIHPSYLLTAAETVQMYLWHNHGSARSTAAGGDYTSMAIKSLEDLQDDQANAANTATTLRLYSARDRTVDLVVF